MTNDLLTPTQAELLSRAQHGQYHHALLRDPLCSPPTQAELTAAIGPAEDSPGLILILDVDGDDSDGYLIASNGQSWYTAVLTKAA